MSRVLVTGGAGFIGSHVVDRLIAAGHKPRILDCRLSAYHPDVDSVVGDLLDPDTVRAAVDGCGAVIHLAAAADVGEVAKDPAWSESLNARGTLNVLEACRGRDDVRVVYASTIWVYSDVDAACVDEDTLLPPPAHLYTATKLAGELYCRSYRELYNVESTILRFGIPYGPRARPAAVLPIFVNKALAGEPLTLAGGGLQSRRFVYVEDLAEGVVRGLAPVAADRTYNLVGDEDVTIRQIADTVSEIIGDVDVVVTEGRAGDFGGAEVSGARAADELDWRPETNFAEGARKYVDWHRSQEAAVEPAPAPLAVAAAAPVSRASRARSLHRGAFTRRRLVLAVVGILAGALAALLSGVEAVADPVSVIGTIVLLAVPTALIARIDWTRDRRDAALVFVAMLGGAALGLGLLTGGWHLVVDHLRLTLAVVVLLAGLGTIAVRQLRAARA